MKQIIDLNTFADGGFSEKMNIELQKVLENIADPNTDPAKARKVTATLVFKSDKKRQLTSVVVETKCALAPAEPIATAIIIDYGTDGKVTGGELKSGAPGQMYIDNTTGEILDDRGENPVEELSKPSDKVVSFK